MAKEHYQRIQYQQPQPQSQPTPVDIIDTAPMVIPPPQRSPFPNVMVQTQTVPSQPIHHNGKDATVVTPKSPKVCMYQNFHNFSSFIQP